ncbi:ATPase, T2SS/T4P/T4SS family, partial [Streptomyces labedae]|uniref:ATPase, T2SS/T4P/T4SS family n=1 Tax=Streptomyces labedae TaxID=285569 RepID=UPI0031F92039
MRAKQDAGVPAKAAAPDRAAQRKQRMNGIKSDLHKRLLENLNLSALEHASEAELRAEINTIVAEALSEMDVVLNSEERATLNKELYFEVMGLGPLEPLLQDDTVNDILVNGPKQVFVERAGKLTLSDVTFRDERHLLRIIDKIVSAVGRRVDESNPYVDARLA